MEVRLDKEQEEAGDGCERGPDAAGDAFGTFAAKGRGGEGDDDGRERERDGESAGVEVAAGKDEADGWAAEEQGASEKPADCRGADEFL